MDIKAGLDESVCMKKLRKKFRSLSYTKLVAAGYLVMIVVGTFLLMLPVSAKSGEWTSIFDALTTATSASCVTGLVVFDTFTHWTVFGQLVILCMIQIGGLGYMTIIALFSLLIGRKIGLRERSLLKESTNSMYIGGLIALTKKIVYGTIIFESLGTVVLCTRFIPYFGEFKRGFYYAFFHSVSAFCNAGFDLFGIIEPYSSVSAFNSDPVVMFTLMALIFTGGIGFIVWNDVLTHKLKLIKYKLHSKLAVTTSVALIVVGAVTMYILEYNNTLKGMSVSDSVMNALFSSVTTRTAGFNSLPTENMTPGSTLINIIFMLIGGSPGSTAGGMKTTTFAVLLIASWSNIRNSKNVNIFSRRIENDIIRKALTVAMIYASFVCVSSVLIGLTNPSLGLSQILFETASAIGTVGLTGGAMSRINLFGQMIITILMYCGRVGSMSFAMIFTESKSPSPVMMPSEKIIIG